MYRYLTKQGRHKFTGEGLQTLDLSSYARHLRVAVIQLNIADTVWKKTIINQSIGIYGL